MPVTIGKRSRLMIQKLWSFGGNLTSRWFRAFNSRSKAAPLHIRLTRPPLRSLNRILGNPDIRDRIYELHVDIDFKSMPDLVGHLNRHSASTNSSERAPAIRSLRTRCYYYACGSLRSLSCKLPHLWRLELADCIFPLDSPVFVSSNLTHLIIRGDKFGPRPTVLGLLSILEKQPHMETLDLKFDDSDPSPSGLVTDIHLPRLRKLLLSGPSLYIFDLAAHISYPSTSTLVGFQVQKYMNPTPVPDSDSRILGFLSRHYGRGKIADSSGNIEPPTIRRLSFEVYCDQYEVDLWLNTDLGDPSSLLPSCHIEILCRWHSSTFASMMSKDICEILPLAHLHRLDVEGLDMMSESWLKLLGVMDNVEELRINGKAVVAAINALRPYAQEDGWQGDRHEGKQGTRQRVPLPNLHRLQIVDVDFNLFGVSTSDFTSCLEARKRAHRGLSLLVLRRCESLSSSMVEKYIRKGIAAVVDWDGDPAFDGDDDSSPDDMEYYSDST